MRACAPVLLLLSACGSGLTPWVGSWSGSASINDGRLPTQATGTLTVMDRGGRLELSFRGNAQGSMKTLSCPGGLFSASLDAQRLVLAAPVTCQLAISPADGCTLEATFTAATLSLSGGALSGSGSGRSTSACPSRGSEVADFGFSVTGMR